MRKSLSTACMRAGCSMCQSTNHSRSRPRHRRQSRSRACPQHPPGPLQRGNRCRQRLRQSPRRQPPTALSALCPSGARTIQTPSLPRHRPRCVAGLNLCTKNGHVLLRGILKHLADVASALASSMLSPACMAGKPDNLRGCI